MPPRYLLCRPRGGLNDTLCRIESVWQHARVSGRQLWIDGALCGLRDCLSRYFVAPPGVTLAPTPEWMDRLDCSPAAVNGRVTRYVAEYDPRICNYIDPLSGARLAFDEQREHAQTLLVHEQCGGGPRGIGALRQLALRPEVARAVRGTLESLGSYTALHVRNTDYQTDYAAWFAGLAGALEGRIVLCTDDRGCQQHARRLWGDRVVFPAELPDTGGRRLHYNMDLDRYATNVGALTDLFVLAGGRRLLFTHTRQGIVSGFSMLAQALHADRATARRLLAA